jgi:hypothetical protein
MLSSQQGQLRQQNGPSTVQTVQDGKRRLTHEYQDGRQCVEEFDLKTDELLGEFTKAFVKACFEKGWN